MSLWSSYAFCTASFACIISNKICFIPLTTRRSSTLSTCVYGILKNWHNCKSSSSSRLIFMMTATFFSSDTLVCNNNSSMSFLKFISVVSSLKCWNIAATEKCFWLKNSTSFLLSFFILMESLIGYIRSTAFSYWQKQKKKKIWSHHVVTFDLISRNFFISFLQVTW